MNSYSFTLRIGGISYDGFETFADDLFSPEVDCTVGYSDGLAGVDFTWEASTLREAGRDAIAHVHAADPSAYVVAIEAEAGYSLDEAFAA